MFFLGFILGLLVAAVVFLILSLVDQHDSLSGDDSYRARAAIHDIEYQTIHALLAAELAAQRDSLNVTEGPQP